MSNPFLDAAEIDAPLAPPNTATRNNNPGNLRWDGKSQWQGMTGTDPHGFVQFDTPENGQRALSINLGNQASLHGLNTVRGIVGKYAPPSDGNDTNAYIAKVAQGLGVGPDDQIDPNDPRVNAAMQSVIIPTEQGSGPTPSVATSTSPAPNPFLSALDDHPSDQVQGDEPGWHRLPDGRMQVDISPADAPDPNAPKQTSQALGFFKGLMLPVDNAATWADAGAKKLGIDTDAINRSLGLPTTEEANAGHKAFVQGQEWKGVRPGKIGELAGGMVPAAAIGMATGNPYLAGAATGALDTDNPNDVRRTALSAALGAVGGKAGDVVVKGVSGAIAPQVSQAVRELGARGVQMTPGQMMGGTLKRLEDAGTSVPIVGDLIRNAQTRSIETANRAALNEALSPIGKTLPAGVNVGRDAASFAQTAASDAYEKSLTAMSIAPETKLASDLAAAQMKAAHLPPDQAAAFDTIMKRDVAPFMTGGNMSGEQLQAIKRGLDKRLATFQKPSASPADELTIEPLQHVHDAIMEAAERQNPHAFSAYQDANAAYARVQRINDATAKMRSDKEFTPSAFAQAVSKRGYGTTTSKVAAGDANMQKLADAMMKVLPSSVPDSGTAFRSAAIGGGGLALSGKGGAVAAALLKGWPVAIPAAAGLSAYTKTGQKALVAALLKRPAGAQALARHLAKLKAPAVIAGSAAAPQLAQGR